MTINTNPDTEGAQGEKRPPETEGPREKFLLAMYAQLWNYINRDLLLV